MPTSNIPSSSSSSSSPGLTAQQLEQWSKDGYVIIPDALDAATIAALVAETKSLLQNFSLEGHPMTTFTTGDGDGDDDDDDDDDDDGDGDGDEDGDGNGDQNGHGDKHDSIQEHEKGKEQRKSNPNLKPNPNPKSNPKANLKGKHVDDEYFLTSADKIRFFFEEDALDHDGRLTVPKWRAINKIGHALHDLSPPFRAATVSRRNAAVARSLAFRDPRVLQSMVICKQPGIGGRVPAHQDSSFLYTDPPSAVGFWYALEDATAENGALSFARGSHRRAGIRKRFVTAEDRGAGTEFVDVEAERQKWPSESHLYRRQVDDGTSGEEPDGPDEDKGEYTLTEVRAGSLVLIHGNVLHKSEKNTSGKSRFIYTFHVIEGEHAYDARNWLQPTAKGFTRLNGAG